MTIFLIRHATAGRRTFSSDDLQRPLDDYGRLQADSLVQLLGDRGITEVHTSAATRCSQTVAPLAASLGLPVLEAPAL